MEADRQSWTEIAKIKVYQTFQLSEFTVITVNHAFQGARSKSPYSANSEESLFYITREDFLQILMLYSRKDVVYESCLHLNQVILSHLILSFPFFPLPHSGLFCHYRPSAVSRKSQTAIFVKSDGWDESTYQRLCMNKWCRNRPV